MSTLSAITIPEGVYEVQYSFVGYEQIIQSINLTDNIIQNVELNGSNTILEEVIVKSKAENINIVSTDMGIVKLDPKSVKTIPVIFGEQDILKTIRLR